MNNKIIKYGHMAGLFAALIICPISLAQDEGEGGSTNETIQDASCEVTCPSGQIKVSFADGNRVSCVCTEQGSGMTETVETVAECEDSNDDGACD